MKRPRNTKIGRTVAHPMGNNVQQFQGQRPKVKVARSYDASDVCWSIRRERNVLETPNLVGRFPSHARAITCTNLKVKCLRSRSPSRLMLRPEVRHIFQTERPTKFNIGTPMEHALSMPRPAITACEVRFLHVSAAAGGHATCY